MKNIFCLALLLIVANAFAAPMSDTGQMKCYNNTVEIPGQSFYGQDASYSINQVSYTKLDSTGNALPDSATSWTMVEDNVAGLIWELKTNKDGVQNYNDPHDADNAYSWYDSISATNSSGAGTAGDGTNTEDFINALNDANYGGFSDWRLPTLKELRYIVNNGIPSPEPSINTAYFPNTVSSCYWSSTTVANDTSNVWGVNFFTGYDYSNYKLSSYYVRAVRSVPSGSLVNSVLGSNSIGTRNTIKFSDFSGSIPSGGLISIMAWDTNGNAIPESAGVTPLVLYNHGTTSISGSSLAARFTSVPMLYKFSIASPNVVVTNVKISTDDTFKVPVVYLNGMTSFASNSIGNYNTIKITDFSGSIPSGGSITVLAWDANGNAISESSGVPPLVLYNHGTTMISGSSLAARFPTGSPMIYQFNIQSAQVLVTNVKNSTDGKLNIPVAYSSGVSNYVSNSIGKYNTLEISDLSGSIPSGALISVSAWDASGNAIPESAGAPPLVLYNHGTNSISGSILAARFPTGSPISYSFSIASSKVLITNVKSSTDGLVEIPSVNTYGLLNFAANYVSSLTTIKISDMSGALSAGGAAISITAWDANGNAIPESASPLVLYSYGTTTITGSDLAARFPSGFPVLYEFSIGSLNTIVTSLTTSVDGTIKTPTVFTLGPYGGI